MTASDAANLFLVVIVPFLISSLFLGGARFDY